MADDNDELARKAIVRRQEHEKIAAALEEHLNAAHELSATLRRQLEAMEAKLADAKRRLGGLTARKRAAAMNAKVSVSRPDSTVESEAFAKFDRMREKVELAEAEAEAMRELTGDRPAAKVPGEARCDAADDVEAELAMLKKRRYRE